MGIVPYIAPGFGLAKAAADVFEEKPDVEGLILHQHGIFRFGETAREAYERMIEMVSLAESRLRQGRPIVFPAGQIAGRLETAGDLSRRKHDGSSLAQTALGQRHHLDHALVSLARRLAEAEDAVLVEDQPLDVRLLLEHCLLYTSDAA